MNNFTMYNPTNVHFGKGCCEKLGEKAKKLGSKALLIYGKNSIKKNGIYDLIVEQLGKNNMTYVEYGGIKSNPLNTDADEAVALGRDAKVDCVIAIGGGSVIDTAKMVSVCIPTDNKVWDFYQQKAVPEKSVPLIAVLTLAATGSEMNGIAVLQNHETQQKFGYRSKYCFPMHSFLDPTFTFSVPANYTAYGVADLIAHSFEAYFGGGECTLSDRFCFSIISDAIHWSERLFKNLHDYDARAAIMYDATMALNGQIAYGKANTDWGVHALGHNLSLLFDTPHGASLSIMYLAWMKHFKPTIEQKLIKLGKAVFNVETADECINKFEEFFKSINTPIRLSEVNIFEKDFDKIIESFVHNRATGYNIKMTEKDYAPILKLAQ
ncbi:MAG: iron-containing alcohol dehydrogenase [Bacteroidales bacterium]|jgi:alcohol dehydrogenase YqhD (iron-dependent ADH family)